MAISRDFTETSTLQLLVSLFLILQDVGDTFGSTSENLVANCNPMVDTVFLLDGHKGVTSQQFFEQKHFVSKLLRHHTAPSGAVQVGYTVCRQNKTTRYELQPLSQAFLRNLSSLSQTIGSMTSNHTIPCIATVQSLFRNRGRTSAIKIAVLIVADDSEWRSSFVSEIASDMKSNDISIVVVAVGNRDFRYLNSLRNLASKEDKFFVLSSFNGLKRLSSDLSTGSCLPISLNIVSDKNGIQETTTQPVTKITETDTCRVLSDTNYYERFVPFLGWLRSQCRNGWRINVITCVCEMLTAKHHEMRSFKRTLTGVKLTNGRRIFRLNADRSKLRTPSRRKDSKDKKKLDTTMNIATDMMLPTKSFVPRYHQQYNTIANASVTSSFTVNIMHQDPLFPSVVSMASHVIESGTLSGDKNSLKPSYIIHDRTVSMANDTILPTKSFTRGHNHLEQSVDLQQVSNQLVSSLPITIMPHVLSLPSATAKADYIFEDSEIRTRGVNSINPSYDPRKTVINNSQNMFMSTAALLGVHKTEHLRDVKSESKRDLSFYSTFDGVYHVENRNSIPTVQLNFENHSMDIFVEVTNTDEYLPSASYNEKLSSQTQKKPK